MKKSMKTLLSASLATLCAASCIGMTVGAYALSEEVKDATPALLEATSVGVWKGGNPAFAEKENKDAILVMTFGTTFKDTREKTIEAVEKEIQKTFPNIPIFEAYTSHIIIDRVAANEGIKKLTPEEAFEKLRAEGYTRVAVVALNIIPGMEYDYNSLVTKQYAGYFKKISLATPLMYFQGTEGEPDQVVEFIQAIQSQIPKMEADEATLLLAHGTPHPGNAYYSVIQNRLEALGMNQVYVYSVEGRPNLEDVIPKLKEKGIKHVTLMPIMMVAGDHANNDMAGDEEDSHKSILEKEGMKVSTYIHGLGENEQIRLIYTERAKEAVEALQ